MDGLIGLQDIAKAMSRKGYQLFEDDSKPYNLNIISIRSEDMTPNVFNDINVIMWKYKGHWSMVKSIVTTDPGLYYMENPINVKGTAILKPMQHRGMWKLGKHKGETAFQQAKPCTVYRDKNKDNVYDNKDEETGMFGINGHNANDNRESTIVGKWSAGCTVWANPEEHKVSMLLAKLAVGHWGNGFSHTLLEEKDL